MTAALPAQRQNSAKVIALWDWSRAGRPATRTAQVMTANEPRPDDEMGRVLPFRGKPRTPAPPRPGPVEDLTKYARDGEPDDYRQRMINNGLAFLVIVVLGGIGIWLASSIAEMRKTQDCVLSGRRNCAQVDVPPR